jgi:hypothetical protein
VKVALAQEIVELLSNELIAGIHHGNYHPSSEMM